MADVRSVGVFSVIADETTDWARLEQFVLVLRYVTRQQIGQDEQFASVLRHATEGGDWRCVRTWLTYLTQR